VSDTKIGVSDTKLWLSVVPLNHNAGVVTAAEAPPTQEAVRVPRAANSAHHSYLRITPQAL